MKNLNTTKALIVASAMAGLLGGTALRAHAAVHQSAISGLTGTQINDDSNAGKHDCKGKNTCKGQGGCKTGDNGCKAKNSCKGKGGCSTKS